MIFSCCRKEWKTMIKAEKSVLIDYWAKPITGRLQNNKSYIGTSAGRTGKLVAAALLSATAVILQSAGALGGPGFAVSALVTLPISIAAVFAVHSGILAYLTTLCLLVIVQPTEVLIFPFTTGLLGLGIGFSFRIFNKRAAIIPVAALTLTVGISILLYCIQFPVMGPIISTRFHFLSIACMYIFSFLYSWLWVEICRITLRFLSRFL